MSYILLCRHTYFLRMYHHAIPEVLFNLTWSCQRIVMEFCAHAGPGACPLGPQPPWAPGPLVSWGVVCLPEKPSSTTSPASGRVPAVPRQQPLSLSSTTTAKKKISPNSPAAAVATAEGVSQASSEAPLALFIALACCPAPAAAVLPNRCSAALKRCPALLCHPPHRKQHYSFRGHGCRQNAAARVRTYVLEWSDIHVCLRITVGKLELMVSRPTHTHKSPHPHPPTQDTSAENLMGCCLPQVLYLCPFLLPTNPISNVLLEVLQHNASLQTLRATSYESAERQSTF